MNISVVAGFLVLTIASVVNGECRWTGCEGKLKLGQSVCDWYKAGYYTGKTSTDGCGWDTSKCQCCRADDGGERKWTSTCYGTAYSALYACSKEFGHFYPTGNSKACTAFTTQHECGQG